MPFPDLPSNFKLPSDISFYKEQLDNGIAFIFRHAELGELGRLLLQERSDGQTQVKVEVVGDQRDPMTAQRAAMLIFADDASEQGGLEDYARSHVPPGS